MVQHGGEVTAMGAPGSTQTASALRKERDEHGAQLALFLWSRTPAHGIVLSPFETLPPTLVNLV